MLYVDLVGSRPIWLLTLDASSVQMAPEGSRRIVWMIKRMIKRIRQKSDAKASKGPSLALAAHSIAVAVEPVRVGWQNREVAAVDVIAVQVGRRRRDTEVRV